MASPSPTPSTDDSLISDTSPNRLSGHRSSNATNRNLISFGGTKINTEADRLFLMFLRI